MQADETVSQKCSDLAASSVCDDAVCGHREKFPLFISQDGTDEAVHQLAVSYAPEIKYLNHVEDEPPKRNSV